MQDNQKLWSSVGSAGTVDLADLDKVVFDNSIVELIGITPVIFESRHLAISTAPILTHIRAVVRYGVTPVDGITNPNSQLAYGLTLRYRDGAGQVTARLIQVEIATGTETPLVNFERHSGKTVFQVDHEFGSFGELDFVNNAYYVELTLAAAANPLRPLLFPPAVSVIQLDLGVP